MTILDCPKCGSDLRAGVIPQEAIDKGYYAPGAPGEARYFSRLIAIYDQRVDRTTHWRCPDCGEEWPR